ncbi:MAG: cytochrome c family protein [Alphaproteobacteria bacterium]|nr:cytochrome c family protein [Alphaproteobacteria bacterium]MBV9553949.1 cytochrome c family protein [Alphaproteobacteria bacterium]
MLLPGAARADDAGAAELQKCKICHALDAAGGNRVGPNLHGVFGRKAGTLPGFNFSEAMKNSGIVWDDETVAKYLRNPKDSMPGNRMSFPGLKDEAVLHDLLGQLKQATE